MSAPKNELLAEHHLEAVIARRIVRARDHEAAIDAERIDGVIEHRRRPEADPHHVDAACHRARRPAPPRARANSAGRRGRPRRGVPPAARRCAAKLRPIARGVGLEQRFADDAADVVFAQDRRVEAVARSRSRESALHCSNIRREWRARPRHVGPGEREGDVGLRETRPCRRNRSAGLEAQTHERPAAAADQLRQRVGELDLAAGAALVLARWSNTSGCRM